MNGNPTPCPRCGKSDGVHSIQELAALARMQLGQPQPPPQAQPPQAQPGYMQQPQAGPLPGYMQEPQAGALPGYAQEPRPGPLQGGGAGFGPLPHALPPQAVAILQTQIAIADRHPDICACLKDGVIFLAGGQRTLPFPNLAKLTVEQADQLVATLRSG